MLKIGLTGGIGSGKTLVSGIFSRLGIPVFYADAEAAMIMKENPEIHNELKKLFGEEIIDNQGNPDRKKLRQLIFSDEKSRHQVNTLIHPYVKARFNDWCRNQKKVPFVLIEAAILFESGFNEGLDAVILVNAPEEVRIKRVVDRDQVEPSLVTSIIKGQMDENEKKKRSDFVIYNDGSGLVVPQVIAVYNHFKNVAVAHNGK